MGDFKPQKGTPYPLGAHYDGNGVNFALYSRDALKVELCFFDHSGTKEQKRFLIEDNDNNIFCIYIEGAKPGQVYGYRVYGTYNPEQGLRFNPNKLLIDPYAKKLTGRLIWHKAIFGYDTDNPLKDLSFCELDSAPYVPKSVVIDENNFDWGDDVSPRRPLSESIIYETHVRGHTMLHPHIKDACRGRFSGLADKSVINYLKWLGISAVELLPVQAFLADRHIPKGTTRNYWGYETCSFFCVEPMYLTNDDVNEFKSMVKSYHNEGLEVILDVVYNHTAEGNQMGPTLCYRGIDNRSYYTLNPENPRFYYDSTGCGASFNVENPYVTRLVLDSLRYWVEKMHVDGFRFDLTPSLCRSHYNFSRQSGFLYAVMQDPVLQNVKLIAEPWDVGPGGYQLGAFPAGWSEWNDRYRDVVRRFWKGDQYQTAELASRISGSSDIFNYNNRNIWSSLNFITAHDGFCLRDLVSYNHKHNCANGEDNRDGTNSNWSSNGGMDGEDVSQAVKKTRLMRAKAMMATLMLSYGVPMIKAGDEFLHAQMGNNNPYCQDNVLTWLVWEAIGIKERNFTRYVKKLISLRKRLRIHNKQHFFTGKAEYENKKDLTWYTQSGVEFRDEDWYDGERKSLAYCISRKNRFILGILNADEKKLKWVLPNLEYHNWSLLLDTSESSDYEKIKSGGEIEVPGLSVLVFEIKK